MGWIVRSAIIRTKVEPAPLPFHHQCLEDQLNWASAEIETEAAALSCAPPKGEF